MQLLSKKGVLFLTAGFQQPYVLQNVASYIEQVNNSQDQKQLKIILSDGEIYISAMYLFKSADFSESQKCQNIKQFDILKINGSYRGSSHPILISTLQILSQNHRGLYGQSPISMHDYLQRQLVKNKDQITRLEDQNVRQKRRQAEGQFFLQKNQSSKSVQIQIESNSNRHGKQQVQNCKEIIQFSMSSLDDQYDFLNDIIQIKDKKNQEKQQNNLLSQSASQPVKRIKPNQDQIQVLQNQNHHHLFEEQPLAKPFLENLEQNFRKNISQQEETSKTQNNQQIKVIQVDVIDLDDMTTQRQHITYYSNTKRVWRKSHLKSLEEIFQSQQKQKHMPLQLEDSITVPKGQSIAIKDPLITPTKETQILLEQELFPMIKARFGTTTSKKKIKQEYNSLISNLFQDNHSFKILCRVNHLFEWTSKNGTPCLGAELMDMEGHQIKAIMYINHCRGQCPDCSSIIQVGKVYSFQNGQCKRNQFQKNQLQLIFNLRTKVGSSVIGCAGRNKVTPVTKICVYPLFQNRFLSISRAAQMYDEGKNYLISVYGIISGLKVTEYQLNKNTKVTSTQENSAELAPTQNNLQQKKEQKLKKLTSSTSEGFKRVYLNGYILDPLEKKQISFGLMIPKPINQFDMTTSNFLQRNFIKQGALVVLHNVRINSMNNNTIKKLEKTKRTYLQVISDKPHTFSYDRTEFAAEKVSIADNNRSYLQVFNEILSLNPAKIQQIIQNPRFLDYSEQPYTGRRIDQMNFMMENNILPDEYIHSSLKDVKIHSIQQKPSIEICEFCKKKIKSDKGELKTIKFCTKCKKMVKSVKMHIFGIVFADNTSSFFVEVLRNIYIQTLLGVQIEQFLRLSELNRKLHLDLIKYGEFNLKIKSQKKVGSITHTVTAVQKMPIKAKINEIKCERKGNEKHHARFQTSW